MASYCRTWPHRLGRTQHNNLLNNQRKEANMKQSKLITKLYQACLDHDEKMIAELRKLEFKKIFKHRAEHKRFGHKWSVVRI